MSVEYVNVICNIEMYNSEAAPRNTPIDTAELAAEKLLGWFDEQAVNNTDKWNNKLIAKVDSASCPSAGAAYAFAVKNNLTDIIFNQAGARRRLTTDEAIDVFVDAAINESTPLVVFTDAGSWAPSALPIPVPMGYPSPLPTTEVPAPVPTVLPSWAPTQIPTIEPTVEVSDSPTFMPTQTEPTSSPTTNDPTPQPTGLVCTTTEDCPDGQVCCTYDIARRRSLLFGATYGICKPEC